MIKSKSELLELFAFRNGFALETVKEIQKDREAYIPVLTEILEEFVQNPEITKENNYDYMGHFYSLYLLGEFELKEVFPVILKMCKLPSRQLDDVLGDFVTEDLRCVLAATCSDPQIIIDELVLDANLDEWVRGAAVNAIQVLFWEGKLSREQTVNYYRDIFERMNPDEGEEDYNVWSCLVSNCANICPVENIDLCRKAFNDGCMDPMFMRKEELEHCLSLGIEKCIQKFGKYARKFIKDTVVEFGRWACFRDVKKPLSTYELFDNISTASVKVGGQSNFKPTTAKTKSDKKKKQAKKARKKNRRK